jgi:hypothetical protein
MLKTPFLYERAILLHFVLLNKIIGFLAISNHSPENFKKKFFKLTC